MSVSLSRPVSLTEPIPVTESTEPKPKPLPIPEIEAAIRSIQYGVVQIVIQDGVVVQIDKTEKLRLR